MRLRKRKVDGTNVALTLIEEHNERHALALVDPLGVIEHARYVEIAVQATRWAEALRLNGVGPGDRVVVLAGFNREWCAALLGVIEIGAAAVPVPGDAPVEEIRAVAEDAGAAHIVSAAPRPDLADGHGFVFLSADKLRPAGGSDEEPHIPLEDEVALVLHEGGRGVMHTHNSLLAQADAGVQWLGVGAGERVWATSAEGSTESIWLLLAAWRSGAEIVRLDRELRPEEQLELLVRLGPSAIWLSDDEYRAIATSDLPPWLDFPRLRRALTSGEPGEGAAAFHEVFDVAVAPVYGLAETGVFASAPQGEHLTLTGIGLAVVDDAGKELAPGREGEFAFPDDAPTLFAGYTTDERRSHDWFRIGRRGALDPDGVLRFASGGAPRLDPVEAEPDREPDVTAELAVVTAAAVEPVVEHDRRRERRDAKERERARREEERRAKQDAKAQAKAETQRVRAEERAREEAERATRAAALAEERERAEETKAEEQRQRAEAKEREEAERAERRCRAEEAAQAEKAAAEERRQALEAERAAKAEERLRAEEAQRLEDERRREEQRLEAVAEEPEQQPEEPGRERLAPNVLSTLSHYGIAPPTDPDLRREATDRTVPERATE